jgi:hypothetical protein
MDRQLEHNAKLCQVRLFAAMGYDRDPHFSFEPFEPLPLAIGCGYIDWTSRVPATGP